MQDSQYFIDASKNTKAFSLPLSTQPSFHYLMIFSNRIICNAHCLYHNEHFPCYYRALDLLLCIPLLPYTVKYQISSCLAPSQSLYAPTIPTSACHILRSFFSAILSTPYYTIFLPLWLYHHMKLSECMQTVEIEF
jgi:hypothetical protein